MKNNKTIVVGSKKDKVYCYCGLKMRPTIMEYIIEYRCPKLNLINFLKHSLPVCFKREL